MLAFILCALLADQQAVLRELTDFLAIPNLADDTANINRNAAALEQMMQRRGIATRRLTIEGAPPVVVGDLKADGATRTIAFYAHYDGQPVDPKQWTSPPWTPVLREVDGEQRLYARSASDDKAPIVAMLAALDRMRAKNVKPRVNLRFVFEGEEEAGSPHLGSYLAKYPDVLRPDAWIICDGPVHQSRRAQLAFGARGVLTLDLVVYGPARGLHDGHYGNWVPNPIVALTHLIGSMRDEDGRILIDGFYDDVVPATAAEKEAIAAMPPVEAELRRQFQIGRTEGESLNERILLPALNVSGIQSGGVGESASNTIQTSARAAIDFRLVPAQTPESVKARVERHLAAKGWTIVRDDPDAETRMKSAKLVRVRWGSGYPAARTPLDLPLSKELAAIMTRAGHEPVRLPTMGGSVPIHLFQQPDNTPAIVLPIVNHDNNQHAANENLRLQNLWDGIEIFEALFAGLQ
ncbi:MAG TPA: M20/M25/M40 family metallo-hydrolase [Thermoanaerobaculia bacterium]|nr:M20/M25/M40 family metallo-hydrolase [Thermoanaerobaculia bacterium]